MNCKPGDLALVIGDTFPYNKSKVVTCVRLLNRSEHDVLDSHGPVWLIDTLLQYGVLGFAAPSYLPWCPDRCLMPVNPLDDEATEHQEEACA